MDERYKSERSQGLAEAWAGSWFWIRAGLLVALLGPLLWLGGVVWCIGAAVSIMQHEVVHGPGNTRAGDDPRFRLAYTIDAVSSYVSGIAERFRREA